MNPVLLIVAGLVLALMLETFIFQLVRFARARYR